MLPNTDKAETNTASNDELNPLSNPLLAANMGRWAEVYFTNRPEHRDQAVADLLRELEIEAANKPEGQSGNRAAIPNRHSQAPTPPQTVQPLPANPGISCTACGYNNLNDHSFCGMCGAPLLSTAGEDDTEAAGSAPLLSEQNIHAPLSSCFLDDGNEPSGGSDIADEDDALLSPGATHMDDSDLPHFARQPEPVPYRYRLYLGVVLASLLGGLIYVAKRGNLFSDGQQSPDARVIPAAQPASNPQAAQNASDSPLPVEKVEKNENPPHPRPEAQLQPRGISRNEATSPPAPRSAMAAPNTPAASRQRIAAAGQSGTADLAAAEKYLGGNQGSVHDPREALPLLWDAVAKGNAPATLVLSDLYLRGDGVAQNCDQARLLLDLAARKGVKGAGERLRHLPAFGCR